MGVYAPDYFLAGSGDWRLCWLPGNLEKSYNASIGPPVVFPSYLSLIVDVGSLHDKFFHALIMAAVWRHHQRRRPILKRHMATIIKQP